MSFRLAFPSTAIDGRVHRQEEVTLARISSQRPGRPSPLDTPMFANARLDGAAASLEASPAASPPPQRRHLVFPDPVAFKFLEEDPSVTVIERKSVLKGYELYLVEQWACSRKSPTLVIATYTGDAKHSVVVGVLSVPKLEEQWSPHLRVYFKAIQQYHARPRETPLGELMVTNLSSFPSALTVIPVPDGDIRKHRQVFIVNEDLKRLGCSGRSGLTLSDPTPATQAKFLQLYKTSEKLPFFQSVLELIKLCQVALFIFGKLEREYIDGLLCDVTETAINDWWTEIGSEYYNIEPTDGILGPTTVAALLGTLMGARNRLSYYGAPVSKDVFDVESTKRGIGYFQRAYKLDKTRRLDRKTLHILHTATAKAAAGEGGWGVQKAVKSTVAEIGGERGKLVMGMVGGRDKAGIGEIETPDLDRFISLAYGERARWLWHGKPRKTLDTHEHSMTDMTSLLFGKDAKEAKDDAGPQLSSRRTQSVPIDDVLEAAKREDSPGIYSTPPPGSALSMADSPGDKDALRKNVFKSVAGRVNDARSGLGRIRDAVGSGFRGHGTRPSEDRSSESMSGFSSPGISALAQSSANLTSPVMVNRAFTWKNKPEEYADAFRKRGEFDPAPLIGESLEEDEKSVSENRAAKEVSLSAAVPRIAGPQSDAGGDDSAASQIRKEIIAGEGSLAGSVADDADLQGPLLAAERASTMPLSLLQRRHSIATVVPLGRNPLEELRWPSRLSFSAAEESVLRWEEIADLSEPTDGADLDSLWGAQTSWAESCRALYSHIADIQQNLAPWVTARVASIEALDDTYASQVGDLQELYYHLSEAFQRVKAQSTEMVAEERAHAAEAVKDIELQVAKLEYQIAALVSKVQDVEDGVAHFEAQVADVERRAEELKVTLETESWLHWAVRTLTGIGTGPNITRGPSQ